MKILDGRIVSQNITIDLKKRVQKLSKFPKLIIIQVGRNIISEKYIKNKLNKAKEIGIKAKVIFTKENISEIKLKKMIVRKAKHSTGLIIQLPLPKHLNKQLILDCVPFEKDVDGLATKNNLITPATPKGIMTLLKFYGIEVKDKNVAVVGKSNLVGRPIAKLCKEAKAKNVWTYDKNSGINGTQNADILIVAAGSANLIKKDNIKKEVVIIDVGINTIADKKAMQKIVGDVDIKSIGNIPFALSPVPGGVGPMTVISLMENIVEVAEKKVK